MKNLSEWQGSNTEKSVLLKRCKTSVQKLIPNARIILYGSHARLEGRPESDYDLLILVDTEVSIELEDKIGNLLYEIELDKSVIISAIVFNEKNWEQARYKAMPLYKNIALDGVML